MCLANQNVFDPKPSMDDNAELVDGIVEEMKSLCIANGNALSGEYCGRSKFHLIEVR